jgi:hypothetical protein
MNVAAPESLESDTVTAGGAATVRDERSPERAHGVESSKALTFECTACLRATDGLYCLTCAFVRFAVCRGCNEVARIEEMQGGTCARCQPEESCTFCHQKKDLFFYGCCAACYAGSAEVRALVDGAHPATWPSAVSAEATS